MPEVLKEIAVITVTTHYLTMYVVGAVQSGEKMVRKFPRSVPRWPVKPETER